MEENKTTETLFGRKPKWNNVDELKELLNIYFKETDQTEWTITGLALALGTCRQTLLNYEKKDDFLDTIKKAKLLVENQYEIDLKKAGRTGTIFALKNFDWKDKSETDITSGGEKLESNKETIVLSDNAIKDYLNDNTGNIKE